MTSDRQTRSRTTRKPSSSSAAGGDIEVPLPTFMDHVRELRNRFFAVALVFLVGAAAAYPFFDKIVALLMAPLKDRQLVYLTPAGAFSFIIQVCLLVGLVFALPAIIYNVYRFIVPVIKKATARAAVIYTLISLLLALCGIIFTYNVILPASLYFLTSFELNGINPMLTVDSYFSFVMAYMVAGIFLFQIPLIMLIINDTTPLNPGGLMKHQGKIILGSFIIAAIISPTPDALNQTLLASPIVVTYQAGIIAIWLKNRQKNRQAKRAAVTAYVYKKPDLASRNLSRVVISQEPLSSQFQQSAKVGFAKPKIVDVSQLTTHSTIDAVRAKPSIDGVISADRRSQFTSETPVPALTPQRTEAQVIMSTRNFIPRRTLHVPERQAVDGFFADGIRRPAIRLDQMNAS